MQMQAFTINKNQVLTKLSWALNSGSSSLSPQLHFHLSTSPTHPSEPCLLLLPTVLQDFGRIFCKVWPEESKQDQTEEVGRNKQNYLTLGPLAPTSSTIDPKTKTLPSRANLPAWRVRVAPVLSHIFHLLKWTSGCCLMPFVYCLLTHDYLPGNFDV